MLSDRNEKWEDKKTNIDAFNKARE